MALVKNASGDALNSQDRADIAAGLPIGPYLNTGALSTAFPASTALIQVRALVGASAPYAVYECNGSAWVQLLSAAELVVLRLAIAAGGIPNVVANWAALPAASSVDVGYRAMVQAAIIPGGPLNTRWYSDGTNWCPESPIQLVGQTNVVNGTATATAQVLKSVDIPAGLLLGCKAIQILGRFTKSGTADANLAQCKIPLGVNGNAADTQIVLSNLLTASSRANQVAANGVLTSATTWRFLAIQQNTALDGGAASASAAAADITISSAASALKLSMSITPGASPADTPSIDNFFLRVW